MLVNRRYIYLFLSVIVIACEKKPSKPDLIRQDDLTIVQPEQLKSSAKPEGELIVQDLKPGKGAEAKQNQTLRVNYKAFFASGTLFDSTEKRGKPFTFTLGEGTVIKGWDQGIRGMKIGGLRRITVPPHLAYGEKGISGLIPPSSTLIFEVELLAIDGP